MFCSTVVRSVSPVYLRAMSASARACVGGQIAERQRDGGHRRSPAWRCGDDVGRAPRVEARRGAGRPAAGPAGRSGFSSVACRSARNAVQRGSGRSLRALLQHEPLELVDAELLDQELDAGARRGSPSRRGARTRGTIGLRQRQQLLLGQELVEQLRGVRHRAEPAADVELEAALRPCRRPRACCAMQPRSWKLVRPQAFVLAAGERDLELAPEVLRVVVAEQEERRARWRRA